MQQLKLFGKQLEFYCFCFLFLFLFLFHFIIFLVLKMKFQGVLLLFLNFSLCRWIIGHEYNANLRKMENEQDFNLKEITDNLISAQQSNISSRNLQVIVSSTPSTCNLTLYEQWANERYVGILSSDVDFWIYQTQPQVVLTNGLALQLVVIFCKRQFSHLYFYKAGRSGPITIQNAYKPMCSSYCLQSDLLHQRAMAVSGCDCVELSTQESADSFTTRGNWCSHNSGRLLCEMVGYCGVWECDLSDFMCPRYEWNKKQIAYIGPGTCTSNALSFERILPKHLFSAFFIVLLSVIILI